MPDPSNLKRVAFSPGEFATLFGKSQTWGYRQIYAGKVTAITEHGRILIPAKEVERILETAGIYDGKPKRAGGKEGAQELSGEEQSVWQRFVELRRQKSVPIAAQATEAKLSVPLPETANSSKRRANLFAAWKKQGKA